ncbi:MAG: LacI family transcriptional regulator [Firmicutes bacterium]|nr:LacI family transcriptional regulator [Bacillota bacterium]MDH7495716.1 LacI family DNA-binding transcriptional regulator [Bacillota bacterium]
MTTIKDVAMRAGVSPSTVSRALANSSNVKPETRDRILRAVKELNYTPNALARSLRSRRSKTFGVMIPDIANPFFAELVKAIEASARKYGYNVVLCNSENDKRREIAYLALMREKQVDGLIFTTAGDLAEAINSFQKDSRIPVVLVDREIEGLTADTVVSDGRAGAIDAVRFLIAQGHSKIGCLRGPTHLPTSKHRAEGFVTAMNDSGLEVVPGWVLNCDFSLESGFEAGMRLAKMSGLPSAVFAVNDLAAIGFMQALESSGIKVPDDISVVGFDDVPLSRLVKPKLTTVAQPVRRMGEVAVKLLLQRISGRGRQVKRVVLPTELIIRESVRTVSGS